MDIIELLQLVIKESATAALALFAIWSLKLSHTAQLLERDEHATELKAFSEAMATELRQSTETRAVVTEVIRRNTEVMDKLLTLLAKQQEK